MTIMAKNRLRAGLFFVLTVAGFAVHYATAQDEKKEERLPGQITEEQLGTMLKAMGLKPEKTEKRYDFAFKAVYKGEEWNLSMSTVLSQNEKSIWVMAWLDKIPSSAADVPRTALLRLLAANDTLGNGKFFAYIPTNKRFVLQRVVINEEITTRRFQSLLQDLGVSTIETYPKWAVSNWKRSTTNPTTDPGSGRSVPSSPATATRRPITKSATRTSSQDSRFEGREVR